MLGDESKKRDYDAYRKQPKGFSGGNFNNYQGYNSGFNADFANDMFKNFFKHDRDFFNMDR